MVELEKIEYFNQVLPDIEKIMTSKLSIEDKLKMVCLILKENIPHYDWVGFYLTNQQKKDELILGPFAGDPTEHVKIMFGQGICGQAAQKQETFIIEDVSKETNYLSCSANVKSEIVLPIFKDGIVWGELDIDSHELIRFDEIDADFLEKVCQKIESVVS